MIASVVFQSHVSEEERKDDMTTENAKINANEQESFISDMLKDLGMEVPTPQKKKKRKQNKNKSKGYISEGSNNETSTNRHI